MIESFNQIYGNSRTIDMIKRAIRVKSFPRFSIFAGLMGVGKSSAAHASAIALTCEFNETSDMHRVDKLNCTCTSCQNNHLMLPTRGVSETVSIINCGEIRTYDDVSSMLKIVFDTKLSNTHVFILEEAHALKNINNAYTALLERIDRIPEGVYVIMCTTIKQAILKELRSRAIIFDFRRVNHTSMYMFAKYLCQNNHYICGEEAIDVLLRRSNGIPREFEKQLKFFMQSNMSDEDIINYLRPSNQSDIIELLYIARMGDLVSYQMAIETALSEVDTYEFLSAFKDVLTELVFLQGGYDSKSFAPNVLEDLKAAVDESVTLPLLAFVDSIKPDCSIDELKFKLVKLHFILNDIKPKSSNISTSSVFRG